MTTEAWSAILPGLAFCEGDAAARIYGLAAAPCSRSGPAYQLVELVAVIARGAIKFASKHPGKCLLRHVS